jgi:hypothetical protein
MQEMMGGKKFDHDEQVQQGERRFLQRLPKTVHSWDNEVQLIGKKNCGS